MSHSHPTLRSDPDLIEVMQQVSGIIIDSVSAGALQFVLTITAGK
jgi:hypothetical protein